MSAESTYPFLRKFAVIVIAFLCLCYVLPSVYAQDHSSPLWQKIEDARVYMNSNKLQEARTMFEQALKLAEKENDHTAEAICIGNLGTLCDMTENTEDALKFYKKGYELAEKQNNNVLMAKFAGCLVRKFSQKGDARQARKWLDIQERLPLSDDPAARFYNMYDKASVLLLEHDPVLALHYLDKAWKYAEENHLGDGLTGAAMMGAGDILYKIKRYNEAIDTYQQGLATLRKTGNRTQEAFALRSLYVAYKQIGDSVKAARYREEYRITTDSMYEGMHTESVDHRLDNFEKEHNQEIKKEGSMQYFFLIIIIVVLLGIVAFVAVALHKLSSRQQKLLDSSAVMRMSPVDDSPANPVTPLQNMTASSISAETDDNREQSTEGGEGTDRTSSDSYEDKDNARPVMLTYAQQKTLLEKIDLVMENVNLICREDFNLAMLAKSVNSNTKYVSMVINDLCGKTFKTYLNEYRIKEACRRLTDKDNFGNLTIKAIHQELGFRTTTSFVAAFRKVMGMTPSEYKKQQEET